MGVALRCWGCRNEAIKVHVIHGSQRQFNYWIDYFMAVYLLRASIVWHGAKRRTGHNDYGLLFLPVIGAVLYYSEDFQSCLEKK